MSAVQGLSVTTSFACTKMISIFNRRADLTLAGLSPLIPTNQGLHQIHLNDYGYQYQKLRRQVNGKNIIFG